MVFEHNGSLSSLRSSLTLFTAPIQYMVNWPVVKADSFRINVSSLYELRMENEELRSKQLLLEEKLQKLLALETENAELKALLQSSVYIHGKTMVASLLSVALAPFSQQVILDKGSHDGIFTGQPVLDAYGVMGQVISVGPTTSRVLLISDQQSAIPVQNNRNGFRTIVKGQGYSGNLDMLYVPDTEDLKLGDLLITSGLGERYPSGYPLGEVSDIQHEPGVRFAKVRVKPKAHLNRSRQVLLVWPEHLNIAKLVSDKKIKQAKSKIVMSGAHE